MGPDPQFIHLMGNCFPDRLKRSQEFRQSCILPCLVPIRRYDYFTHQVSSLSIKHFPNKLNIQMFTIKNK